MSIDGSWLEDDTDFDLRWSGFSFGGSRGGRRRFAFDRSPGVGVPAWGSGVGGGTGGAGEGSSNEGSA